MASSSDSKDDYMLPLDDIIKGFHTDKQVVVHPIVLLSIVDHYNRVAKGTSKRVIGTLLGEVSDTEIHVISSYAVPFEEDPRDPTVWFLDHNYHEHLCRMCKKVNAKEKVIGWYSTGPKIKPADLEVHEVYRKYTPQPIYVVVDLEPKDMVVPTNAYYSMDEPNSDKNFRRTFVHIPSTIGAYEAEEVGVEHLLRDLRNASTSTLATKVGDKLSSIRNLVLKLQELSTYVADVVNGTLPSNPSILYNLQNIFNLLPDLTSVELVKAFAVQTNDCMLSIYLGSMVRSVIALHNLINNKVENRKNAESEKEKDLIEAEKASAKTVKPALKNEENKKKET